MLLITEWTNSDLSYLAEGTTGGSQYISGVFMEAEKVNRNGRIYPKEILEAAVARYVQEQVKPGRAVGELNHPEGPTVNLDKVSHKITELKWDGDDVKGKALILNTPMGRIVKGLLEGGVQLGVSTRGMGSLDRSSDGRTFVVRDDFMLTSVDIVQDPSASTAFVNGIMEGKEFLLSGNEVICEKLVRQIKRTPSKMLAEAQINAFKTFLSSIGSK